eukprot:gene15541-17126_t
MCQLLMTVLIAAEFFPSPAAHKAKSTAKAGPGGAITHTAGLTIDYIMKNYSDMLEGLGHIPGSLPLDVHETINPVVMSPCRVPLALQSKLKEELELETLGAIAKVTKPTDWVSNFLIIK